ncbi:two-component system C4-dicarboxylate transport sensor histidine kinase DctB [Rhizobium azooxidifex]|uniref:C4-dicarboxylate transport sensor protein n=1 Tax=Mycoplana azooxidifex TaxID=1636188 RepID=A0A7W6GKB5_9HYPH|nr:ATP-binding protein [Mycoplana azooxidifex]MBB3976729.1 two-component system C4-dicarboxylate transport sensor histidine kinase DctB [Mycoplana azooxidifex]
MTNSLVGSRPRLAWATFAGIAALLVAAALVAAGIYGRSSALSALEGQGRTDANIKVALLRAVLERPRAVPLLLSLDRDVQDALSQPTPGNRDRLNRKLEQLVQASSASVIYVTDASGLAIASSNWQEPDSFVGNNYAFRSYFTRGMAEGKAEHFALGTVSRRPGLYISHRVGDASAPQGVVVVKMEFDGLEREWSDARRPVYVVDDNDVVLISSIPSWRFMTTRALPSDSLAAIRESLQFGDAPLVPLPIAERRTVGPNSEIITAAMPGGGSADYLRILVPAASTPWRLGYLVPMQPSVAAAVREARMMALLALAPLLATAAFWLRRRQLVLAEIAAAEEARYALERRVEERTADLSHARDRLQAEIAEHRSTETRLQTVQQELVQANRLAILGQVAAGVAHEINQPVATIRAYADNAKVFLSRQQAGTAMENLDQIAGLTERIGAITDDLKALARKGRAGAEPVNLREAIEGAVELLRSRFAGSLEALRIDPSAHRVFVLGNRLRLEQVFINLFQNALEAVAERSDPIVTVSTEAKGDVVAVSIADNGPGIAPEVMDELFSPFNSSKEKGLGLGLVISKDIVADYGGRIEVRTGPDGTCFTVHLKPAGESP